MMLLMAVMYSRNLKPELMNLMIIFFMVYYTTLNFMVNSMDFIVSNQMFGINYYHDDDFVSSFSFKTHTTVNILLLSLVSAQFF